MPQPQFAILNHTSFDLARIEVHDRIPSIANGRYPARVDAPLLERGTYREGPRVAGSVLFLPAG